MQPQTLPIHARLPDVHAALLKHAAVVLQAEPGAGKSTALPLSLLQLEAFAGQRIIMLEPRRVAARSIAAYLARQLNERVGETVGYQVRNDRRVSDRTRLEIVTEGVLTRRLQSDPELPGVGLIIFDEFHERSIHADIALMLTVEVQQALRSDLKLLVMSATIDSQALANYLDDACVIECAGRAHPVQVQHLQAPEARALAGAVTDAVTTALSSVAEGDVLVFLPGRAEIERCMRALTERLNIDDIDVLPLHGSMGLDAQERVLKRDGLSRRVILSTNIAETSLTIDGVTAVIDSGLERRLRYDPVSDMTRLDTVRITQASATQRAGRAGRLGPGWCWRLWPESVHSQMEAFQPAEIMQADLSASMLELFAWGLTSFESTPWLSAPPRAHYDAAFTTLTRLGLVDEQGQLSAMGKQVAQLGLSPRVGAMLHYASQTTGKSLEQGVEACPSVALLACDLAALIEDRDILVGFKQVDIDQRLMALEDYRQHRRAAQSRFPLHVGACNNVLAVAQSLQRRLRLRPAPHQSTPLIEHHRWLAQLLLHAFPDRLACRRGDSSRYLLANGRGVTLPADDPLSKHRWLVVVDCDGQKSDGLIFSAAVVDEATVREFTAHKLESKIDVRRSADGGRLLRVKRDFYQALLIDESQPAPISGHELTRFVPELLHSQGLNLLDWNERCQQWLRRAQWLGEQVETFPEISEASLLASIDQWLVPYLPAVKDLKDLKRVALLDLVQATLTWDQQQQLEQQAPASFTAPSGRSVPIRYDEHQGPVVAIALQELFGLQDSPRLAEGRVPLRFELLSPARRPIQTTSDLRGFWQGSYVEVAKDMRGRYPKHRWPENPLDEKAGHSLKRKA